MELKEAITKALKSDKHTRTDPFLLHARVSDLVGNDYEAKKAAEQFYRLDKKYKISKTLLASAPVRYKKRKKRRYKVKPMPIPPDNAYVYFTERSPLLHLSGACPRLKEEVVLRATCACAKYATARKGWTGMHVGIRFLRYRARSYVPPICRLCGTFRPECAVGAVEKLRMLLLRTFGVGCPTVIRRAGRGGAP